MSQQVTSCLPQCGDFIEAMLDGAGIASDVCVLAGSFSAVPVIGAVATPFLIYNSASQAKDYFNNMRDVESLKEKAFWGLRGAAKAGQAANEVLKPTLVAAEFFSRGHQISPALNAAKNALPITTLALGSLGMVTSAWNLVRTAKEYHRFRHEKNIKQIFPPQEDNVSKVFFDSCYRPFPQKLDGLPSDELRGKLEKAIRFTLFDHSVSCLAATVAVIASIMLIACPGGALLIPATGLLISSTGMSLVPLVVKQFLKEREKSEYSQLNASLNVDVLEKKTPDMQ